MLAKFPCHERILIFSYLFDFRGMSLSSTNVSTLVKDEHISYSCTLVHLTFQQFLIKVMEKIRFVKVFVISIFDNSTWNTNKVRTKYREYQFVMIAKTCFKNARLVCKQNVNRCTFLCFVLSFIIFVKEKVSHRSGKQLHGPLVISAVSIFKSPIVMFSYLFVIRFKVMLISLKNGTLLLF